MRDYDVVGIGNPLMDILVRVDDTLLPRANVKKGMFNLVSLEESRAVLSLISNLPREVEAGDATANCLAGIANLGGRTLFVGKTGRDEYAAEYERRTVAAGTESGLVPTDAAPTGTVVSLITPDAERTFATHLGAALLLEPQDLPEAKIARARYLHLTGYQLEDPGLKRVALRAIAVAGEAGTKVSIDLADPGVIARNRQFLVELCEESADVLYVNEEEARVLTGLDRPQDIMSLLADIAPFACLKLGARGSMISRDRNVVSIDPFPANAIDTTGAGDTYAAGVLYGLTRDLPTLECGRIGSFLSARVVEAMGARLRESYREAVYDLCPGLKRREQLAT